MNQSFFMMAVKDEINFKAILNCERAIPDLQFTVNLSLIIFFILVNFSFDHYNQMP